jgi:hypothetical protein
MRLNQKSPRGASPDLTITGGFTIYGKAGDRMIYGFMISSIWGAFFSIFIPTEDEQ